ncbi:hypothetical protein [Nostoc sp.]|uniref:hypothetical protein n=1 Tax=Nostoc sp. TaxID=1180 RepID=UPI0035935FEA
MIAGKLEIKINELPKSNTVDNSWQQFDLDCDGCIIIITVKPKIYKKLTDAASNYLQWVRAMSNDKPRSVYAGKLGQQTKTGSCWRNPIYKFSSASPRQKRPLPSVQLLEKVITQSG